MARQRPVDAGIFASIFLLFTVLIVACSSNSPGRISTDSSLTVVDIPSGAFIRGSSVDERAYGYALDERAYGHTLTRDRGWYDRERPRASHYIGAFSIMRSPVTNAQYYDFVRATMHRAPQVNEAEWQAYGFVHDWSRAQSFNWQNDGYPHRRGDHPVVLVSYDDANAYARWLSERTGELWRLPTEDEWEKAARGVDGAVFPWGDEFDPTRLNSHDMGPFDTKAVASFPSGVSPFGIYDAAGQVYEWTATGSEKRRVVKGGSWDDKGCGVCRPAARHMRPTDVKHILIGFRLVRIL